MIFIRAWLETSCAYHRQGPEEVVGDDEKKEDLHLVVSVREWSLG